MTQSSPSTPARIVAQEPRAVKAWVEQWLAVFGANRLGVGARHFLWHIFSNDRYPSIDGLPAYDLYEQHEAPGYIVLANDRKHAFALDRRPDVPPGSTFHGWTDFYVFPANLAWTLARTHEETWLGPYFARHPDYARLHRENLAALDRPSGAHADIGKGRR